MYTLIGLWILSHVLALGIIRRGARTIILAVVGVLLVGVYVIKPYTYDLPRYAVYFETGFLESFGKPLLGDQNSPNSGIHMEPRDLTGDTYNAYSFGFDMLFRSIRAVFPTGSILSTKWDHYRTKSDSDIYEKDITREKSSRPGINETDTGPIKPHLTNNALRADWMLIVVTALGLLISLRAVGHYFRGQKYGTSLNIGHMLLFIPIIIGTIFFFIGSQNVLRQFLSITLILGALGALNSKRIGEAAIFLLIAFGFHSTSVIFGIVGVVLIATQVAIRRAGLDDLSRRIPWGELLPIMVGSIFVLCIYLILRLAGDSELAVLDTLKIYAVDTGKFDTIGRSPAWYKLFLVGSILLASEMIMGVKSIARKYGISYLRRATFLLFMPMVIYPEIFSRMLMFYFGIEMLYVVVFLMSPGVRERVAASVVFCAYGFAPNAINVLVGPGWSQALVGNYVN